MGTNLRVWNQDLLTRLLMLVTDYRDGASADTGVAQYQGRPVSCAELVARAVAVHGIWLPVEDRRLCAVLERDGVKVDPATAPEAAVLATVSGRVGVRCHAGVVESNGGGVSIVAFDPDRYTAAWLIPAVGYVGRA